MGEPHASATDVFLHSHSGKEETLVKPSWFRQAAQNPALSILTPKAPSIVMPHWHGSILEGNTHWKHVLDVHILCMLVYAVDIVIRWHVARAANYILWLRLSKGAACCYHCLCPSCHVSSCTETWEAIASFQTWYKPASKHIRHFQIVS